MAYWAGEDMNEPIMYSTGEPHLPAGKVAQLGSEFPEIKYLLDSRAAHKADPTKFINVKVHRVSMEEFPGLHISDTYTGGAVCSTHFSEDGRMTKVKHRDQDVFASMYAALHFVNEMGWVQGTWTTNMEAVGSRPQGVRFTEILQKASCIPNRVFEYLSDKNPIRRIVERQAWQYYTEGTSGQISEGRRFVDYVRTELHYIVYKPGQGFESFNEMLEEHLRTSRRAS
jgi:hypothetical protein